MFNSSFLKHICENFRLLNPKSLNLKSQAGHVGGLLQVQQGLGSQGGPVHRRARTSGQLTQLSEVVGQGYTDHLDVRLHQEPKEYDH